MKSYDVLAQSEETGELDYKPVEEIFNRATEETNHIQVEDTVIVTTAEHPFWVIGKGWVESRDLKAGDRLVNDEGKEYAIEKIEAKQETIRVYNFSVGGYHTYFVTGLKLWTHNCSMGGGARGAGGPGGSGGYVPRPGGGGGNSLPKKVTSPKQQKKIVVDLPKLSKQLQNKIAQFQKNRTGARENTSVTVNYGNSNVNVYRGGNSFKVKPTHGISLDTNPNTFQNLVVHIELIVYRMD